MPAEVQDGIDMALVFARMGFKSSHARPIGRCGEVGVLEVVEECCGGTYWAVYSVRYVDAVYVLHCCRQLPDITVIKTRLKAVELFKRGGWYE